tara:strand:- start:324 stop:629 length:306 start_codon:yes stop_codon:yes gene_type:complete
MFKTEDIIGDIVFISLVNGEDLKQIGITKSGHFLVKGFDHLGLWVQHPGIITDNKEVTSYIKEGVFLVMWNQINTIMHYPNREGYDFPSEFDKEIGFLKDN